MIAILIITLLIITNPKLTFIIGISLGVIYGLIFYIVRNYLGRIGKERLKNNKLRFTTINEAFSAAKEVKLGGLEKFFIKNFSDSAKNYATANATSQVIAQLPRFIVEGVAFGGILLIVLYIISQTGSFNNALPIISLYIFAGYRLIPAIQQIYISFTKLTFISPSLEKLCSEIKNIETFPNKFDQDAIFPHESITLNNVYFHYPNSSRTAVKNINLNIPAKSTVGLVGITGSGKTTTVDIILGLLEAQKGTLKVDGKIITKQNIRSWQRSIGYVPQNIYLSDDSIYSNIAFGVDQENINKEAVIKACKIANLHEFIIRELPNQYQTAIGERGVRLSGGQRQRIGIARALYHNPHVLILDEATNALDNQTEKIVMESISNINKDVTIILIAHRLDTVKNCDIIYKFDQGQLIGKGNYKEMIGV